MRIRYRPAQFGGAGFLPLAYIDNPGEIGEMINFLRTGLPREARRPNIWTLMLIRTN